MDIQGKDVMSSSNTEPENVARPDWLEPCLISRQVSVLTPQGARRARKTIDATPLAVALDAAKLQPREG